MKLQPCASNRRPSKLCRLLLCAFTLKLALLGLMLFDPVLPGFGPQTTGASSAGGVAQAATGEDGAAAAPPAVPVSVPSTAPPVAGQAPGFERQAPADPAAVDAMGSAVAQPQRALPGIGGNASSASGAEGGGVAMDALARRQEELARKEQELRVLEGEISAKLEHLQMLENRLAVMIRDAEGIRDAKFRHLVDVLSNMKARQAAEVLETLDHQIAVKVLAGMRGRQAGEILTHVKPEIAARLAESLARMQLPFE